MTHILIIDNRDSFTNNLAAQVHAVTGNPALIVDNATPYADLPMNEVDGVIISPGPGHPGNPDDFGVCLEVIQRCERPVLGVCLGHQGIVEAFGGTVTHAPQPAHGLTELVEHCGAELFAGLPTPLRVVRYHSLIVRDLPEELEVTSTTSDGLVMALRHRNLPIWGVQFHPESIEAQYGTELIANFVRLARAEAAVRTGGTGVAAAAFSASGGHLCVCPEVTAIPWPSDLAHYFRTQFESTASFWLDAENSDHADARYSVMGGTADDIHLTYELAHRQLTMTGPTGTHVVVGDFFALIGDLIEAMSVDSDKLPVDVPYRGGLVGYLGYELKALSGGTDAHTSPIPDASLLWPAHFVVLDHFEHRAWRVATVPAAGNPRSRPYTALRDMSVQASSADYRPGPVDASALSLRDDRTTYLGKIHEASRLIRDGESYEVCLTNRATLPAPQDPLAAYERMRAASPVPYGAYLRLGDIAVLSSSPELFLSVAASGEISTAPIKGTRPRGCSPSEDEYLRRELAASRKDRAENLMIVDLVRHDLNAVCEPSSVHVPEPFAIQSFRSVHQMVSVVKGQLRKDIRSAEAVRSCFPPGSMVGAPKIRTMEIIDRLENEARGIYSGAIGWLDASGTVRLSVVIRTVVLRDDEARIGIGGAITALSDPEDEFTETLVKASVPHHSLVDTRAAHIEQRLAP